LSIASIGTAIAGAAVWSAAGMVAMSGALSGSSHFLPKPQFHANGAMQAPLTGKLVRSDKSARILDGSGQSIVAASLGLGGKKSARHADAAAVAEMSAGAARVEAVVKKAALTPEKLASLLHQARSARKPRSSAMVAGPVPERFASLPAGATVQAPILLAFADPSPVADGPFSSLLTGPLQEDLEAQDPNTNAGDAASLSDMEDPLSDIPLPQPRPRGDEGRKPAAETDRTKDRQVEEPTAPKADERDKAEQRQPAKPRQMTYGRPNEPSEGIPSDGSENRTGGGFGRALKGIFGGGSGAKARNGVAVYDIKAAKVYMPDGSVLEAHSGIGKMADNPRYIDVKMRGPTPPHTYDLKLREKRFHGVEALRMLPVDGKNRNGRTGLLAHSYLLRGGREESHGCVAFKDYQRFLSAFKKGKVKQLVVVASGGRSVQMASAD